MAQGISLVSGSPLIGSPIVFSVTPETHQDKWTFHRVILRVYAKMESEKDMSEYEFSNSVETDVNGNIVPSLFDVSSALQAAADKYAFSAVPPQRYPYIKFRIESCEEWMIDGYIYDQRNIHLWPGVGIGGDGENLLPGANTGVGWTNANGAPAEYFADKGFHITDALMSPLITFNASMGYTLMFRCDDQFDLFLYNPQTGTLTPLDVYNVNGMFMSNISHVSGKHKIRIQIGQEGYCKDITLQNISDSYFYGYAFMGAWTDLERMNANESEGVEYLDTLRMSRKPTSSPEIVFTGCEFIYPDQFPRSILDTDHMSEGANPQFVSGAPTDGPRSLVYTPQAEGAATIGGHNIYAVPRPAETGYQLRFVNGLGCMETLHVQSLVKREANITTAKHAVARQETLKKFSRSVVRKSNDRETWALTSGPLDEQWASWYVHEFLMAEQIWIGLNSHTSAISPQTIWFPCHVVPEETTVLEDREKAQPLEVLFRLEMDINGSPI